MFQLHDPARQAPTRSLAARPAGMPHARQFAVEPAGILGRIGALEVRLAAGRDEIMEAQALRYRVFVMERSGGALPGFAAQMRESDAYDAACDHLLVIDRSAAQPDRVVGTYRLLRQDRAAECCGFYSAREFDIATLLRAHAGVNVLELGRSCVAPDYRTHRTMELLWRGIWAYIAHHRIGLLFGCASLEGTDPERLAPQLRYLARRAPAPDAWSIRALPPHAMRASEHPVTEADHRIAATLPPLIKAYLRVGARFAASAAIDRSFRTTDVFVVLPVADITQRYLNHYRGAAPASAAIPSR